MVTNSHNFSLLWTTDSYILYRL